MSAPLVAYKGFTADWKCNDYQFEVGKSYTHEGPVNLCASGFHACEYPLDVFTYYPPTGRLAQVELTDVDPKTDSDSKRVARTISIKASIDIVGMVKAAIEYVTTRCEPAKAASATGDSSAASATGYRSAASATGRDAIAAALGYESSALADKGGVVVVAWWDAKAWRKRLTIGYVGEDGIAANVAYRCDAVGALVRA